MHGSDNEGADAFAPAFPGLSVTAPVRSPGPPDQPCVLCGRRTGPHYSQVERWEGVAGDLLAVYCEAHAPEMPRFGEARAAPV